MSPKTMWTIAAVAFLLAGVVAAIGGQIAYAGAAFVLMFAMAGLARYGDHRDGDKDGRKSGPVS